MSQPSTAEIPVIDLSRMLADPSDANVEDVARQIERAARGTGFFYIRNHGIAPEVVQAAFDAKRAFYARPLEEKMAIARNAWHRGYSPIGVSTLKSSQRFAAATKPNQLESFSVRQEVAPDHPDYERRPLQGPNQWPAEPPSFKPAIQAYDTALRELGLKLLHPIAVAVGERRDFFDSFFEPPTSNLRLIQYPPAPPRREEDLLGIQPHTDYGFITILAQDNVGGLQVQRVDGSWIDAVYIPDTFIINVGDALARWTNDVFNSTPHRVISPTESSSRSSIGYFFDPSLDAVIECLPQFCESEPAHYEPIRYGDYFAMRLDANHPNRKAAGVKAEAAAY
jgi:isopenicillin N synthase-like dioxygenase